MVVKAIDEVSGFIDCLLSGNRLIDILLGCMWFEVRTIVRLHDNSVNLYAWCKKMFCNGSFTYSMEVRRGLGKSYPFRGSI